ncbi:hypothetical protein [Pleurocapsa sp. FMAR1]|uniref:hypothetical protein n=1 Tax=Pleurocapsa sp. FMAR1 TaxID=3040204 RepID=UPI0029C616BB|nr:hypothetical protein [Pleurocapsa sp. FMAR1]
MSTLNKFQEKFSLIAIATLNYQGDRPFQVGKKSIISMTYNVFNLPTWKGKKPKQISFLPLVL